MGLNNDADPTSTLCFFIFSITLLLPLDIIVDLLAQQTSQFPWFVFLNGLTVYVVQAGLELMEVLLPQLSESWDYRHVLPCPATCSIILSLFFRIVPVVEQFMSNIYHLLPWSSLSIIFTDFALSFLASPPHHHSFSSCFQTSWALTEHCTTTVHFHTVH